MVRTRHRILLSVCVSVCCTSEVWQVSPINPRGNHLHSWLCLKGNKQAHILCAMLPFFLKSHSFCWLSRLVIPNIFCCVQSDCSTTYWDRISFRPTFSEHLLWLTEVLLWLRKDKGGCFCSWTPTELVHLEKKHYPIWVSVCKIDSM